MGVNRLQNSRFFSKSVKKSVKCGVRVCEAREKKPTVRFPYTVMSSFRPGGSKRSSSVSPQSRYLFSPSFQTFCLTAREYLNTQKYGLFCSLGVKRPKILSIVVKIETFSPLAVNRVRRVNRQKILLLRFDNFEEGAKLTKTGCISYYAATLTLFVRVSASFAFHDIWYMIIQVSIVLSGTVDRN